MHPVHRNPRTDFQRTFWAPYWEKLNRGVSKPGCFPLFSGKVQIVSRTLSGLFLVGALNRPRKRKRTNRENPRTIPEQIGKIPEKSGKSQKGQKRTKKEGQVQIGKPPRLKPPRLAALDLRGPATILVTSRKACSDSIAKTISCLFLWGIARFSRDTLQMGYRMDVPVWN